MCQEVDGKWREGPADGGMFAGFSTVDDRMAEFRMDHYMEKIDNVAWLRGISLGQNVTM